MASGPRAELCARRASAGFGDCRSDVQRVEAIVCCGLGERATFYGTHGKLDVAAEQIVEEGLEGSLFTVIAGGERHNVKLRLMGRHNVLNALAAIAVGLRSGMKLAACCIALEEMRPSAKRGEVIEFNGARIINDAYNSNPKALESMVAALTSVGAQRRIVVAGEMLELGPEGAALHARSGEAMVRAGIDVVIGVRGLAKQLVDAARDGGVQALFVETPEAAAEWLRANLRTGDVVLLKASRGVRLERALDELKTK